MRLRRLAVLFSILSLTLGLACAPFFHIHSESGILHAHFLESDSDHDAPHPDETVPGVESDHSHHHGSEVSIIAARVQKQQTLTFNIQIVGVLAHRPVPAGIVMERFTHATRPPLLRASSPRPPPA